MCKYFLVLAFFISEALLAQAPNLSPRAKAMLESIRITNNVIIECQYEPNCMLMQYKALLATTQNDDVKRVIELNLENLSNNQDSFEEFKSQCFNDWFTKMNAAEIDCLKKINLDITENSGIARMRANKLNCMQTNMASLISDNNLFALQKMTNLLGQYGQLDSQDQMQTQLQNNQNLDAEQKFNQCQAIYDNLKPKFR